jgi:hypothetical protein
MGSGSSHAYAETFFGVDGGAEENGSRSPRRETPRLRINAIAAARIP